MSAPATATAVRIVQAASEPALHDLLNSLNDAGQRPELACLVAGTPFLAVLWDVDYAGEVHYVATVDGTGQVPCYECTGVRDEWAPTFPVDVVLAHDPDPTEHLLGTVDAWWRDVSS